MAKWQACPKDDMLAILKLQLPALEHPIVASPSFGEHCMSQVSLVCWFLTQTASALFGLRNLGTAASSGERSACRAFLNFPRPFGGSGSLLRPTVISRGHPSVKPSTVIHGRRLLTVERNPNCESGLALGSDAIEAQRSFFGVDRGKPTQQANKDGIH